MDDFLYNLRNGNAKRYEGKRKPYSNFNKGYDRQRVKDNRGNFKQNIIQEELVPAFKKMMEEISANYKRIADANERRALAQERQIKVLENIATYLGFPHLAEDDAPVQKETELPTELPSVSEFKTIEFENPPKLTLTELDREKVLTTILEMRKNKLSYGRIAKYLKSQNIPTFTGRGTWHGQTVSRLCD